MTRPIPRPLRRGLAASLAAAALVCGAAACGDDDDGEASAATGAPADSAETAAAAPATEAAAPAAANVDGYCQAAIAAEAAANSEDPAVIGPAFEAIVAAAPAEIRASTEAVVANAEAMGPEFEQAYGEMIAFVQDNCGFGEVNLTATEYAFQGLPSELAAGPTVISLDNQGKEFHELAMLRVNDGTTETVEELLALPEEESMQKLTFTGVAFAPNGATGHAMVDLTPGRYIAICFLPTGATPELMANFEGPDSSLPPGAGPPHFTHGMVQELTVR